MSNSDTCHVVEKHKKKKRESRQSDTLLSGLQVMIFSYFIIILICEFIVSVCVRVRALCTVTFEVVRDYCGTLKACQLLGHL